MGIPLGSQWAFPWAPMGLLPFGRSMGLPLDPQWGFPWGLNGVSVETLNALPFGPSMGVLGPQWAVF